MVDVGKKEVRQNQEMEHREYLHGGPRVRIKCDCQTRVQQKGTYEMEAGKEEVRLIQGVGERMRGTRILGIQYQSRVQCMVNNTHMRSLWHSS